MNIPENFDRWMFDYKEGNLSGSEIESFENFLIKNPAFESEADAWNHAFIADENIAYPQQSSLEKKRNVFGVYGWRAAAVLLLLVGITSFFVLDAKKSMVSGIAQVDQDIFNTSDQNIVEFSNVTNNQPQLSLNENDDLFNLTATTGYSGLINVNNQIQGGSFSNLNYSNSNNSLISGNKIFIPDNNVLVSNPEQSFDQEVDKYVEGEHSGKYNDNPGIQKMNFDVSKDKSKMSYGSFGKAIKKFYKKIEKTLDYPVGLTNLRDPNLGIAQNSILAFNPGFTGGILAPRFEMNYRNQWTGTDMNTQEFTMSFDNYNYQMRGGVGVMLNAKDYGNGAYTDYNISLLYSPKFVINPKMVFEPAIKMTLGMLSANGDKLNPNSSIEMDRGRMLGIGDQASVSGSQQLWYKDYGLGFVLNTKWFYIGYSADNLAGHYENVFSNEIGTPSKSPILMTAIAGFDYESERSKNSIKINRSISPYFVYDQYGERKNLWVGCNLRFDWLTVGGSYSTSNEYTGTIGMQFEKFRMIYRYDMTESTFLDKQVGSHNIGIRFNAARKKARIH